MNRGPLKRWTHEELRELRESFPVLPTKDVSQNLGRSMKSVVSKATQLGLRKSPERMSQMGLSNIRKRRDRANVGFSMKHPDRENLEE